MAMMIRSTCYSNSCSYPHSYSPLLVVLPIKLPLNYGCNRRIYCCSLVSASGNDAMRRGRSDHHFCNGGWKSRFSVLYGNGFDYSISHCHRYRVSRASKDANFEGSYEEERYNREEVRWLREEQRWLREEQRWFREEARWNAERDSLLREISHLNIKIQHLELELEGLRSRGDPSSGVGEALSRITALLQVLSTTAAGTSIGSSSSVKQNQIPAYSEGTPKPLVLEHTESELELESESASHDPVPHASAAVTSVESRKKTTLSLRVGSEGEDVRALQEALLSLGFYSGEEDMEYSSFSSGTQRAVKTWQASIGAPEDGIMTAELLEMLYAAVNPSEDLTLQKQDKANGFPSASVKEVREVKQTVVKKGPSEVEIFQNRVFLLGENRWEEPSRLRKENDKPVNGVKGEVSATKCPACRGDGRLLCMECDGTGEPNVEEQFIDWVEEGAKCPYCVGLGYIVCDACDGKAVA